MPATLAIVSASGVFSPKLAMHVNASKHYSIYLALLLDNLTLALLVARVSTDHACHTLALDNFTFLTDWLY
jgi:hypothetical protein